jgi:hypothetical protein
MSTPRLALPFLSPGQAQKEFSDNEALQTLDTLVAAAVEEPARTTPPSAPALGSAYIVAAGASGAWTGEDNCIAAFTSGSWRFVAPVEGMSAFEKSSGTWAIYRSGKWELGVLRGSSVTIGGVQVVGSRAAAIVAPTGGTTVDVQAREALGQILTALRQHGLVES